MRRRDREVTEHSEVRLNTAIHPEFGIALEEAKDAGVEVLSLKCHVGMDRLEIYCISGGRKR